MITLSRFGTTVTPLNTGALVNLKFGPVGRPDTGGVLEVVLPPDEELDDDAVLPPDEELDDDAVPPPDEELDDVTVLPPDEELDDVTVTPPDEELDDVTVTPPDEELEDDAVTPLVESVAATVWSSEELDVLHPAAATMYEAMNAHLNIENSIRSLDI